MDTIAYTQADFDRDIKTIITKIGDKRFDLIVGINRGGCIPAVCLSHALKIPATMIDWSTRDGANVHPKTLYGYFEEVSDQYNNILLVDDLVDSGVSIAKVIRTAQMFCTVSIATLLYNTDVELSIDRYYGTPYSRRTEPRYFDFWWEVYNV